MPIQAHFFPRAILTWKAGHTDLHLVRDKGSLVGLSMQDYKSLCAAITICATLVGPKFYVYILTPVTLKSRPRSNQNPEINLSVDAHV